MRRKNKLSDVENIVKEWQSRQGDLDCSSSTPLEVECFETIIKIAKVIGLTKEK
jgi:hypothetical protein